MLAPAIDSTMFLNGPFGSLIPRYQPKYSYVYLLHFSERYSHGRQPQHYLGSTCDLDQRLSMHRHGAGARLLEVITAAGLSFEVCRLWRVDTCEEARALEKALKRKHGPGRLCPYCQGKPVDVLTSMYQGHWPFELFERSGSRRPMTQTPVPMFVRRQIDETL